MKYETAVTDNIGVRLLAEMVFVPNSTRHWKGKQQKMMFCFLIQTTNLNWLRDFGEADKAPVNKQNHRLLKSKS